MSNPFEKLVELDGTEFLTREFLRVGPSSNVSRSDVEQLLCDIKREKSACMTQLGKRFVSSNALPPELVFNAKEKSAQSCNKFYTIIENIVSAFDHKSTMNITNVLPTKKSSDGIAGESCTLDVFHEMVKHMQVLRKSGSKLPEIMKLGSQPSWLWYASCGIALHRVAYPSMESSGAVRSYPTFETDLRAVFEKTGEGASVVQEKVIQLLNKLGMDADVPQLGLRPSGVAPTDEWVELVEMVEETLYTFHRRKIMLLLWGLQNLFAGCDGGIGSQELFSVHATLDHKTQEVGLNFSGSKISDRLLALLRSDFVGYSTPEFNVAKLTKVIGLKEQTVKEHQMRMPRFRLSNDKEYINALDDVCQAIVARTTELDQEFAIAKDEMRLKLMGINQTSLAAVERELKCVQYQFGPLQRLSARRTIGMYFDVLQKMIITRLDEKLYQLRNAAADSQRNITTSKGWGSLVEMDTPVDSLKKTLQQFQSEKTGKGKFDRGLDPEKYTERMVLQQLTENPLPALLENNGGGGGIRPSSSVSSSRSHSNNMNNGRKASLGSSVLRGAQRSEAPPSKDSYLSRPCVPNTLRDNNRAAPASQSSKVSVASSSRQPDTASKTGSSSTIPPSAVKSPTTSVRSSPTANNYDNTLPSSSSVLDNNNTNTTSGSVILTGDRKKVQEMLRIYPFLSREPLPGIFLEDLQFAEHPLFRAAINRLIVKRNSGGVARERDEIREQEEAVNKVVKSIAQDMKDETLYCAAAMPFLPVRLNRTLLGVLAPYLDQNETFQDHLQVRRKTISSVEEEGVSSIKDLKDVENKLIIVAKAIADKFEPPIDEELCRKSIVVLQRQVKLPGQKTQASPEEEAGAAARPKTPPKSNRPVSPRPEAIKALQQHNANEKAAAAETAATGSTPTSSSGAAKPPSVKPTSSNISALRKMAPSLAKSKVTSSTSTSATAPRPSSGKAPNSSALRAGSPPPSAPRGDTSSSRLGQGVAASRTPASTSVGSSGSRVAPAPPAQTPAKKTMTTPESSSRRLGDGDAPAAANNNNNSSSSVRNMSGRAASPPPTATSGLSTRSTGNPGTPNVSLMSSRSRTPAAAAPPPRKASPPSKTSGFGGITGASSSTPASATRGTLKESSARYTSESQPNLRIGGLEALSASPPSQRSNAANTRISATVNKTQLVSSPRTSTTNHNEQRSVSGVSTPPSASTRSSPLNSPGRISLRSPRTLTIVAKRTVAAAGSSTSKTAAPTPRGDEAKNLDSSSRQQPNTAAVSQESATPMQAPPSSSGIKVVRRIPAPAHEYHPSSDEEGATAYHTPHDRRKDDSSRAMGTREDGPLSSRLSAANSHTTTTPSTQTHSSSSPPSRVMKQGTTTTNTNQKPPHSRVEESGEVIMKTPPQTASLRAPPQQQQSAARPITPKGRLSDESTSLESPAGPTPTSTSATTTTATTPKSTPSAATQRSGGGGSLGLGVSPKVPSSGVSSSASSSATLVRPKGLTSMDALRKGMLRYAPPVVKKNAATVAATDDKKGVASPPPPKASPLFGSRDNKRSNSSSSDSSSSSGERTPPQQKQQRSPQRTTTVASTSSPTVAGGSGRSGTPLKVADLSTSSSSYARQTANVASAVMHMHQRQNPPSADQSRSPSLAINGGGGGEHKSPSIQNSPNRYRLMPHQPSPPRATTTEKDVGSTSPSRSPTHTTTHSNSTRAYVVEDQTPFRNQGYLQPKKPQAINSPSASSTSYQSAVYRTPDRRHPSPGATPTSSNAKGTAAATPTKNSSPTSNTSGTNNNRSATTESAEKEIERLQKKLAALEEKEQRRQRDAESSWATRTLDQSVQRQSRLSDRPHSQPHDAMRNNAKRDSPQQQNGEWKSASYSAGTANAIMDPVEQLFNTPTKMRTGMTSGTPSRVSPFSRNDSIGSPSLPKMDSTKIRSLLHFRRKEAAGGTPTSNSPSASTASHGGVASLPAAASPHQTSSSPTPHAAGSGGAEGGRPVISATVSRTRYVRENGPRLGQQQRGSGFNDTQQSNNSGSFSSSSPLYATLLREQEEKIMSASGRSNGRGDSPGKAEFYRSLTPNRSQGNSPRNRTPQQRRTSEALRSAAEVARGARKRPVLEGLTRCQNLAEVYAEACKALNLRPNSVLQRTFPTRRGEFIEKIDLSINYVGAKGLQPLFYVMEENRDHLMHLNLSSNNLENTEVLELLEVLCGEAGERLSSLDLSYNPISQSGGQAIYRLIKARPNLVNVQLKGTLIPPRLLQSIVENVEENSYRQHIGV